MGKLALKKICGIRKRYEEQSSILSNGRDLIYRISLQGISAQQRIGKYLDENQLITVKVKANPLKDKD